jgi:hypothetical protein
MADIVTDFVGWVEERSDENPPLRECRQRNSLRVYRLRRPFAAHMHLQRHFHFISGPLPAYNLAGHIHRLSAAKVVAVRNRGGGSQFSSSVAFGSAGWSGSGGMEAGF